jgi:hypothetical protein
MSEEVQTGQGRKLVIAAWIVVPALLLASLMAMTLRNTGTPTGPPKNGDPTKPRTQENTLAAVRDTLARRADLATCRTVVSQLNTHLQHNRDAIPALSADAAQKLKKQLGLDDGDLAELTANTFTALDAFHLESCFLLRDAARSLELAAPSVRGGKEVKQSPLDRAVLAFEWTVREVHLAPLIDPMPVPPDFALRRGSGTPLERALVFLALLEQFGLEQDNSAALQGCLLFVPDDKNTTQLWACGVVSAAEPERLYLFDPRLGLPLPGPGGKGVATLDEARKDPGVLGQLKIDKLVYDVTAERAQKATAGLFVPLTALAPRMRLLQDRWLRDRFWKEQALPSPVRVRLAEDDPGAIDSIRKAVAASGGKSEDVSYWSDGAKILRAFLPKEEGGAASADRDLDLRMLRGFVPQDSGPVRARMPRRQLHQFAAVPWDNLLPPRFRDPNEFSFQSGLGKILRFTYAGPFLRDLMDVGSPRDQLLRGQFGKATPELVVEQQRWQQARERAGEANADEVGKGVQAWVNHAFAVFAAAGNAGPDQNQINALFRWRPGSPMDVFVNGSIARLRVPEVTYQLGLCKHEQAVRLQARLSLAQRAGVRREDDASKAQEAWKQAEYWWKQYLDDPTRPPPADARRLHGEALLHLDRRDEAVKAWRELAGIDDDLQKLARLWLAQQANARPEAN